MIGRIEQLVIKKYKHWLKICLLDWIYFEGRFIKRKTVPQKNKVMIESIRTLLGVLLDLEINEDNLYNLLNDYYVCMLKFIYMFY
jgi:hypothetical protein